MNAHPDYNDAPVLVRVQATGEEIRPEWSAAAYAVTMPGNFDAYRAAAFGCLS